jgi:hypothetical protein
MHWFGKFRRRLVLAHRPQHTANHQHNRRRFQYVAEWLWCQV